MLGPIDQIINASNEMHNQYRGPSKTSDQTETFCPPPPIQQHAFARPAPPLPWKQHFRLWTSGLWTTTSDV